MGWYINSNGDIAYKTSKYTNNELPTWNEVYNEWFIHKDNRIFDSYSDFEMDKYYKDMPRKYVLISKVCNQFNKMISEDGYDLLTFVKNKYGDNVKEVSFFCLRSITDLNARSWIHSFEDVKSDPFIKDISERINMKNISDDIGYLEIYIQLLCNDNSMHFIYSNDNLYDDIIEFMISPYRNYFNKEK